MNVATRVVIGLEARVKYSKMCSNFTVLSNGIFRQQCTGLSMIQPSSSTKGRISIGIGALPLTATRAANSSVAQRENRHVIAVSTNRSETAGPPYTRLLFQSWKNTSAHNSRDTKSRPGRTNSSCDATPNRFSETIQLGANRFDVLAAKENSNSWEWSGSWKLGVKSLQFCSLQLQFC